MFLRLYCLFLLNLFAIRLARRGLERSLGTLKAATPSRVLGVLMTSSDPDFRAQSVKAAMRWAARWSPARATCLPVSLTAVYVLRRLGGSATLCVGVRKDALFDAHAWVEVDDALFVDPETFLPLPWQSGVRTSCKVIMRV